MNAIGVMIIPQYIGLIIIPTDAPQGFNGSIGNTTVLKIPRSAVEMNSLEAPAAGSDSEKNLQVRFVA